MYFAIIGGMAALGCLVALWGWFRHRLELEGQRIAAAVRFAELSLAKEGRRKRFQSS